MSETSGTDERLRDLERRAAAGDAEATKELAEAKDAASAKVEIDGEFDRYGLRYVERGPSPGNACWGEERWRGKTISSFQTGSHKIYREPREPDDQPVREAPFVVFHFTDGTHARFEACEGGLQEDFGDGRGPQRLLTIPYIGITEYSETREDAAKADARLKKHEEEQKRREEREKDEAEFRKDPARHVAGCVSIDHSLDEPCDSPFVRPYDVDGIPFEPFRRGPRCPVGQGQPEPPEAAFARQLVDEVRREKHAADLRHDRESNVEPGKWVKVVRGRKFPHGLQGPVLAVKPGQWGSYAIIALNDERNERGYHTATVYVDLRNLAVVDTDGVVWDRRGLDARTDQYRMRRSRYR